MGGRKAGEGEVEAKRGRQAKKGNGRE